MDKPISLSIKDYIIRKMAPKMMISEDVLLAVINHQFISANSAMTSNNSIEISGFGKFLYNEKRALKDIPRWEAFIEENLRMLEEDPSKEESLLYRNKMLEDNIRLVKTRTNAKRDMGGLEKSLTPSTEIETGDK